MPPAVFRRLVENVRIDGGLTSAVLTCILENGELEILSGHHRTAAAVEAGIAEINAIVILDRLSERRKVAIQLSHNAINGQDDVNILADLYGSLDIDGKKFSGLDDAILADGKGAGVIALGAAHVRYEELLFAFLPEDRGAFEKELAALAKRAVKARIHAAPVAVFDQLFDALVDAKLKLNIVNSAIALSLLATLASERLAEIEADAHDAKGKNAA